MRTYAITLGLLTTTAVALACSSSTATKGSADDLTGLPVPPIVANAAPLKLAQAASFSSGLSPTGVDAAQALGQNLTAQVVQCSSQNNGATEPCDVFAYSRTFGVSP
jgi:hypothetical protein